MHVWGTCKSSTRKLTVTAGEKSESHLHSVPSDWTAVHAAETLRTGPSLRRRVLIGSWPPRPLGCLLSEWRDLIAGSYLEKFLALWCTVWEQTCSCLIFLGHVVQRQPEGLKPGVKEATHHATCLRGPWFRACKKVTERCHAGWDITAQSKFKVNSLPDSWESCQAWGGKPTVSSLNVREPASSSQTCKGFLRYPPASLRTGLLFSH